MRDEHYRSLCDYPPEYDSVIDWIAKNNPAAREPCQAPLYAKTPEEFAVNVVHACIRSVIFGDSGGFCATGMCIAVRVSSNPALSGYKKVILAVRPR